ncbi:MAG: S8 family serine peptidase [Opitutus sp.]
MTPRRSRSHYFIAAGVALSGVLFLTFSPRGPTLKSASVNQSAREPIAALHETRPDSSATEPRFDLSESGIDTVERAHFRENLARALVRSDARKNEAVLTFASADAYRRFLARAQHEGLSVLGQADALLSVRVRYDTLDSLETDLRANPADFSAVGANSLFHIPQKPAVEARAAINEVPFLNSTLAFLGVPTDHAAWGQGVRIAVLDSGVSADPTFSGSRVQYLDVGLGTLPGHGPEDGHGSAVASLAAGSSTDAAGVASSATVLSIRVTDTNGVGDLFTVAQAIIAAVDAGAPIINLSLGGYSTAPALNAAIDYATAHGAVLVAAAGNDQAAQLTWPAADPRVISVGAVDARSQQVTFSNSGPQLQIVAPGYRVQTAWLDGQRVYVDGTSASAPLVAGAIAAVMSQNPALSAQQAWSIVRATTSDAGVPGVDPSYGAGVLNLDWAMNYQNPTRLDPAIASHFYDSAHGEMDFVIQNRSAQIVRALALDVDANGATQRFSLPEIAAGSSYVLKVPVTVKNATANELRFTTQLVTPVGFLDANPANNRLTSRLVVGP